MTDDEVEAFVWDEIKARAIILGDMTGMPHCGVDPNPEDRITPLCEKDIRSNRFQSYMGSDRMIEILCVGEFNEFDYPPLKISFHDLFRFWWNRCVVKENILEDVLEDIFEYFTEKMTPPKEERPGMDLTMIYGEAPVGHGGYVGLLAAGTRTELNEELPKAESTKVSNKGYEVEVNAFQGEAITSEDYPDSLRVTRT